MKFWQQVLAGSFFHAALVCAAPIPGDTDAIIEWAKTNNVDIPNTATGSKADKADAIVAWAKENNIEITKTGDSVEPAPGSADTLMQWAKEHNVEVPSVGAAFEGTADYSVY
ncbi:hypothetical protein F5Y03DRAFT_184141 [Xylaria venustula]|nr:hypothetical protein F5Y03DRAFT_184141 [Xylaria venustula]